MDESKALAILTGKHIAASAGSMQGTVDYICWVGGRGGDKVTLDGRFTADELEAMAWWMRNKKARTGG